VAIFRAIATFAFFIPILLFSRMPQALKIDHFLVRWIRTLAASKRYVRINRSPHREILGDVGLPRLLSSRCQSEIGADLGGGVEPRGIIDCVPKRQRCDYRDARNTHQTLGRFVGTRTATDFLIEFILLF
jgi:hypothetical protein